MQRAEKELSLTVGFNEDTPVPTFRSLQYLERPERMASDVQNQARTFPWDTVSAIGLTVSNLQEKQNQIESQWTNGEDAGFWYFKNRRLFVARIIGITPYPSSAPGEVKGILRIFIQLDSALLVPSDPPADTISA